MFICYLLIFYLHLRVQEGEKIKLSARGRNEITGTQDIDAATPKMLDKWHQTWHRDKKDLGTKFLNITTVIGNMLLLFLLFGMLGMVNHNKICVSDTLLLNPPNVSIPGCNHSQTQSTLVAFETSAQNSSRNHQKEEETTPFFLLNMVILCIVSPLGFSSIVLSLSEYWMPIIQKLRWVIKARRKFGCEVDGILAVAAIFTTLVFSIFSLPVAINATNLNHVMPCRTELIYNIVSTIILTLIGIPSIFFFVKNAGILRKGKDERTREIEDEIQQAYENDEEMKTNLLIPLLTSIIAMVLVMIFMPLRFSETSLILNWDNTKDDCNKNQFLWPATIALHITDIIVLILTMMLSVLYSIRLFVYCKLTRGYRKIELKTTD